MRKSNRPGRRITAATVAVLALAVAVFFGHRSLVEHQAAQAGCERVAQWKQQMSPFLEVSKGADTIAILGDSYSAGDDLSDRTDGWVYAFGHASGARVVVNSVGYTGYAAGGYCGSDQFSMRLHDVIAAHPDVLIIQGGLNDADADPQRVRTAALKLVHEVPRSIDVVLVGPAHAPGRNTAGERAVDKTLRSVAKAENAQYVSAYAWDLDFNELGVHLTPKGHAEFARDVEHALSR